MNSTIKKHMINLFLCFSIFFLVGNAKAEENLVLLIHPYLPANKLITKFTPLTTYLSEKIGQTIRIQISKNYTEHIKSVGEGRMDLAYLGPAPYIQVTHVYGKQTPLAGVEINGQPFFHGVIVTRKNSPVKTLQDLIGKKFAFGDPHSTMSYFVPRFMLLEKGIPIEKLKEYEFLGTHQNVALSILGGYYDAGGIKESVYNEYKARGMTLLAKSPPIAEHLFIANKNIPKKTSNLIRQLMVNLKDPTILTSIKSSVTGLSKVSDTDYDSLRIILKQFDQLNPQ